MSLSYFSMFFKRESPTINRDTLLDEFSEGIGKMIVHSYLKEYAVAMSHTFLHFMKSEIDVVDFPFELCFCFIEWGQVLVEGLLLSLRWLLLIPVADDAARYFFR